MRVDRRLPVRVGIFKPENIRDIPGDNRVDVNEHIEANSIPPK